MQKAKGYQNLILGCCMAGIAMLFAFFFLYHTYIQDIIYTATRTAPVSFAACTFSPKPPAFPDSLVTKYFAPV